MINFVKKTENLGEFNRIAATAKVILVNASFYRDLYEQLMSEGKKETNDPRRLAILKCRIYQLERQCQNLTQQMNERKMSLQNAYNTIENVARDLEQKGVDFDDPVKTLRGVCKTFNRPTENSEVTPSSNSEVKSLDLFNN